jgi:hypothetical protein
MMRVTTCSKGYDNPKAYTKKSSIKEQKFLFYWSFTSVADNDSQAWVVHFDNGNTGYNRKSNSGYVRCVRGRQ